MHPPGKAVRVLWALWVYRQKILHKSKWKRVNCFLQLKMPCKVIPEGSHLLLAVFLFYLFIYLYHQTVRANITTTPYSFKNWFIWFFYTLHFKGLVMPQLSFFWTLNMPSVQDNNLNSLRMKEDHHLSWIYIHSTLLPLVITLSRPLTFACEDFGKPVHICIFIRDVLNTIRLENSRMHK